VYLRSGSSTSIIRAWQQMRRSPNIRRQFIFPLKVEDMVDCPAVLVKWMSRSSRRLSRSWRIYSSYQSMSDYQSRGQRGSPYFLQINVSQRSGGCSRDRNSSRSTCARWTERPFDIRYWLSHIWRLCSPEYIALVRERHRSRIKPSRISPCRCFCNCSAAYTRDKRPGGL